MGIYSTKSKWQKALAPVVQFCVRHRVHPDVFTYGALILSLVAALALWGAGADRNWLWLVPPCVLMRLLLNLMDGQVARALGLADAWGEVKNEFGDRLADAAIFFGLIFGGYAVPWLAALALTIILCGSFLGVLGKAVGGARIYSGVFGKGDRMISLALFTLYPLLSGDLASYNWYLVFAAVAAAVTVIQRLKVLHAQQPIH
jgi:CDP-diacylglycerol--glycerol-3-phosphate 3-phosphatidyltransferase